jgi:hypothetical protein
MHKKSILVLLSICLMSLSSWAQQPAADAEPASSNSDEAPSSNADPFEVIVSDSDSIDLSGVHGPYSFMSLPKDVRDRLIRGVDENGNETTAQLLRRAQEDEIDVGGKPAVHLISSSANMGDRAVQLVRRVRGQSDGWSVKIKNRRVGVPGGEQKRSREIWIFYRNKFN